MKTENICLNHRKTFNSIQFNSIQFNFSFPYLQNHEGVDLGGAGWRSFWCTSDGKEARLWTFDRRGDPLYQQGPKIMGGKFYYTDFLQCPLNRYDRGHIPFFQHGWG